MSQEPIDVVDQVNDVVDPAVEVKPKAKKKGCFFGCLLRVLKIFLILLLVVTVWVVWSLFSVPLRISPETTYITEPLTADGKLVDYVVAFEQKYYPPEMKTDDNGYRLIAKNLIGACEEQIKQGKEHENVLRLQMYEKLGLAPNEKPTLTFQSPHDFLTDYAKKQFLDEKSQNKLNEQEQKNLHSWTLEDLPTLKTYRAKLNELEQKIQQTWTLEDLPMMKEWLDKNNPALDVIVEAVSKPVFRIPILQVGNVKNSTQDITTLILGNTRHCRYYAQALRTRFYYRLGIGDIDGAIQDKIAIHRLGRHVINHGTLLNYFLGIAINGFAGHAGIADNLNVKPTKEQIQNLIKLKNELPEIMPFKDIMESEHYVLLAVAQDTMISKKTLMLPPLITVGQDWNIIFSRLNKHFDDLQNGKMTKPPLPFSLFDILKSLHNEESFSALLETIFYCRGWLISRKTRSELFADELFGTIYVTFTEWLNVQVRAECLEHIQKITLAILLYHEEHGELPPTYTIDENGQPLQSWRVLLLPYLGEEELYKQIRLNESWNSEHNKQFHNKIPTVYYCPALKQDENSGETNYVVIVGDETPFDRSGKGKKLSDFGSESADMILVTEKKSSGNWMNPNIDISFENAKQGINYTKDSPEVIGSQHSGYGGCHTGLRSGATKFKNTSNNTKQPTWENIIKGKERMK